MYKIRIVLDTKEDILRTVLVANDINLEQLHTVINNSFGFNGKEMASFYTTDDEWNQGTEIPLFSMTETGEKSAMNDFLLHEVFSDKNNKLIYIYDFLKMWTFYVEVLEKLDTTAENLPKVILEVGTIPNKAPERQFVIEGIKEDIDDEEDYFDDFNFDYDEL